MYYAFERIFIEIKEIRDVTYDETVIAGCDCCLQECDCDQYLIRNHQSLSECILDVCCGHILITDIGQAVDKLS